MDTQRRQLIRTGVSLLDSRLVIGTAGNLSLRDTGDRYFLITPSALDYRLMQEDDIVQVDLATGAVLGRRTPSTELPLHAEIYKARGDVRAVIHHHSPYATAVSVARGTIPSILDEGVDLTPISTLEYASPGSQELAVKCGRKFAEGCAALLLANHGVLVVGHTLEEAFSRSLEVERLAQVFILSSSLGVAVSLDHSAVERGREFLREYRARRAGQGPKVDPAVIGAVDTVSVTDVIRFGIRSWLTLGSLLHALVTQRIRH